MTYQTKNPIEALQPNNKGLTIRQKNWKGMKWITHQKRLAIYIRDNFQCQYCGKTILDGVKLTLDHIRPIYQTTKSLTDATNLVCACTHCNYRKQDLTLKCFSIIISKEINMDADRIITNVKNSTKRKLNIKLAGSMLKAHKNWTGIFTNLKKEIA